MFSWAGVIPTTIITGLKQEFLLPDRVGPLKDRGRITEEECERCKALILPRLRKHEEEGKKEIPYRTPNHAIYDMLIMIIKMTTRIVYTQLWQMPPTDAL